jgi:hypothetical protein
MIGVAVRVHSRAGDDLGVAHLPLPVRVGDMLELGRGEILLLASSTSLRPGPHSPLAALVKVALVRFRPV